MQTPTTPDFTIESFEVGTEKESKESAAAGGTLFRDRRPHGSIFWAQHHRHRVWYTGRALRPGRSRRCACYLQHDGASHCERTGPVAHGGAGRAREARGRVGRPEVFD